MTYGEPKDYIIHGTPPVLHSEVGGGYSITTLGGEAQNHTLMVLHDGNTWYIPDDDGDNRPWYLTDPYADKHFILVENSTSPGWMLMQIEVA